MLPTVAIGNSKTAEFSVAVGSYWIYPYGGNFDHPAHSFPLIPMPKGAPLIDNGFLAIEPDGVSYLLVDGGVACPTCREYQDAATVAGEISQSLGFGATVLQQPTSSTVFKAGTVVAIYDDTPDMAGKIDVSALIASVEVGIDLSWTAVVAAQ